MFLPCAFLFYIPYLTNFIFSPYFGRVKRNNWKYSPLCFCIEGFYFKINLEIRNTYFTFASMKQLRKPRSYKCSDKFYKKAQRRAKKEKTKLANVVEATVIGYALGFNQLDVQPNSN